MTYGDRNTAGLRRHRPDPGRPRDTDAGHRAAPPSSGSSRPAWHWASSPTCWSCWPRSAAFGTGSDITGAVVVLVATIVLSGLLLLGSLFLGAPDRPPAAVGATIAEGVLVLGLGIWALADRSTTAVSYADYPYDDYGYS